MPPTSRVEDLPRFGAPIYVPGGTDWEVVGVEQTNGVPDGVVVFSREGVVEVRTELPSRLRQPLSIRIQSVQRASVNVPVTAPPWDRVIVDESVHEVLICGSLMPVRVLSSHNVFSFELEAAHRVVRVSGELYRLGSIELVEFSDFDRLHRRDDRLVWFRGNRR